jgi:hypothetical protein
MKRGEEFFSQVVSRVFRFFRVGGLATVLPARRWQTKIAQRCGRRWNAANGARASYSIATSMQTGAFTHVCPERTRDQHQT